jgi:hypothetical protein
VTYHGWTGTLGAIEELEHMIEISWQTRLTLFKVLEEFRSPGDGVGALDSGAREKVVQWCLGGRRVGQKSSIDVQHAQK